MDICHWIDQTYGCGLIIQEVGDLSISLIPLLFSINQKGRVSIQSVAYTKLLLT